jgi:CRISPR system Cascade subunit CasE
MFLSQLNLPFTGQTADAITRTVQNRYAQHQLLWELIGAPPDSRREFLFRADVVEGGLQMLVLSKAPFERVKEPWLVRTREYRPTFSAGQKLAFRLRFAPLMSIARGQGQRGAITNIVEHVRRGTPSDRTLDEIVKDAATRWLAPRATAAGFSLESFDAGNYQNASAYQYRSQNRYLVPSIDVEGVLTVVDPEAFHDRQMNGIGRARHAGCGLMLTKTIS